MVAQNLVLDGATFSIQQTNSGDDGNAVRTVTGSAVTFKVDRCRVRMYRRTEDHSAAQDAFELQRTKKLSWEISVETKLEKPIGTTGTKSQPLSELIGIGGVVVKFVATAAAGGVQGYGLVEDFEFIHDSPSTLSFRLVPYGSDLTVTAAVP